MQRAHNAVNLFGERFGRLVVVRFSGKADSKTSLWECQCDCGNTKIVRYGNLKKGISRSCGCLRKEQLVARSTKHGQAKTPEWNTWMNIKARCNNPANTAYSDYGGRGIKVCEEWMNSFSNFFRDMGKRPSSKHSIERLKNSLGYSKANCVWATMETQANNRRGNHNVTFNGKTQTLSQWAREIGVEFHTLSNRINRLGWSAERALSAHV